MKLYASPRSPFVRKVMVCAHELGLAHRIEVVNTHVAMSTPNEALMRDNPLSKIPTLVLDDGTALFDSLVICEYLDNLADPPRLFLQAPPAKWAALRWQALGNGLAELLILWRNERDRPAGTRSEAHMEAYARKAEAALDALEGEAAALAASPLSIAHVAIACALGYLDFRFDDLRWREGRDGLAAWYERFAARPSMQATRPVLG